MFPALKSKDLATLDSEVIREIKTKLSDYSPFEGVIEAERQWLIKRLECWETEQDLLLLLTHCEQFEKSLPSQRNLPSVPISSDLLPTDQAMETLIQYIVAYTEPKNEKKTQVVLYGLDKPYYLSQKTANQMLSLDEEGKKQITNLQGNSRPARVGNVFYKQNPEFHFTEQAVYQISRLIGGGIVTPTRLLFLQFNNNEIFTLQASLAVEGIGLDELLMIPGAIAGLKEILEEEKLKTEIPRLLQGKYYTDWLSQREYEIDNWTTECDLFIHEFSKLSRKKRPIGFTEDNIECLKKELYENYFGHAILPVIALIEQYPNMGGTPINDLVDLIRVLKTLQFLYPKESAENIIKFSEKILDNFDRENISRHFLLALLTSPGDHKGDNFRVRIKRNSDGFLLPFEVIAIDNDVALEGRFKKMSRANDYICKIKTIFYAPHFLEYQLHNSVIEWIRDKDILQIMSDWCGEMALYQAHFAQLPNALNQSLMELHYEGCFPEEIKMLFERWPCVQAIIKSTNELKHGGVLSSLDPVIYHYYMELGAKQTDPQSMIELLYGKNRTILNTLKDTVQRQDKLLDKHLESEKTPLEPCDNYIDFFQKLVSEKNLLDGIEINRKILFIISKLKALCHVSVNVKKLTIPFSVLEEMYLREKKGVPLFLKENCEHLLLSDEKDEPYDVKGNRILFYLVESDKKPSLIQAVLACGAMVSMTRLIDGYTPLHLAARFNRDRAALVLITYSANMESLNADNQTPLDKAIEYNCHEVARLLLLKGAGKRLSLKNASKWFAQSPQEILLRQQLVKIQLDLAWHLALEGMSQTESTQERVQLQGIQETRYLKSTIYHQIFKNGEAFPRENEAGRRKVTAITCSVGNGMSIGMHLKENPEFVGRELMVHLLAKHIFGLMTPSVALFRFQKRESFLWNTNIVSYPVLASRTVGEMPLSEVLQYHPEWLKNLDKRYFSELIVLTLLINPEDGKADNYLVESFYDGEIKKYRIIPIDNDHAFVRPVAYKRDQEIEGSSGLQVKTILYCLDAMQDPIHEQVRDTILKIQPLEFLKQWLQELQNEQAKIDKLFSKEEKEDLKGKNIDLDIVFKPSIIRDIYQKLCRLEEALQNPSITLFDMLHQVIPELWERYKDAFDRYKVPKERFDALTKGSFENRVVTIKNTWELYWLPQEQMQVVFEQSKNIVLLLPKKDKYEACFVKRGHYLERRLTIDSALITGTRFPEVFGKLTAETCPNHDRILSYILSEVKYNSDIQTITLTSSQRLIQMTRDLKAEEEQYEKEVSVDPSLALSKLESLHQEQSQLKAIQEELLQRKIERFKMLSNDNRARIFNGDQVFSGINFDSLKTAEKKPDTSLQKTILKIFYNVTFRTIRLYGCQALDEKILDDLLKNSSGLLGLEIRHNPPFRDMSFFKNRFLGLEKLVLDELPLVDIQGEFKNLRELLIKNCTNLEKIQINAPKLQSLIVINAPLESGEIQLPYSNCLIRLSLINCSKLDKFCGAYPELEEIYLQDCPELSQVFTDGYKLKKVFIEGTPRLTLGNLKMRYPFLFNFPDFWITTVCANLSHVLSPRFINSSVQTLWQGFKETQKLLKTLFEIRKDTSNRDVLARIAAFKSLCSLAKQDNNLLRELENTINSIEEAEGLLEHHNSVKAADYLYKTLTSSEESSLPRAIIALSKSQIMNQSVLELFLSNLEEKEIGAEVVKTLSVVGKSDKNIADRIIHLLDMSIKAKGIIDAITHFINENESIEKIYQPALEQLFGMEMPFVNELLEKALVKLMAKGKELEAWRMMKLLGDRGSDIDNKIALKAINSTYKKMVDILLQELERPDIKKLRSIRILAGLILKGDSGTCLGRVKDLDDIIIDGLISVSLRMCSSWAIIKYWWIPTVFLSVGRTDKKIIDALKEIERSCSSEDVRITAGQTLEILKSRDYSCFIQEYKQEDISLSNYKYIQIRKYALEEGDLFFLLSLLNDDLSMVCMRAALILDQIDTVNKEMLNILISITGEEVNPHEYINVAKILIKENMADQKTIDNLRKIIKLSRKYKEFSDAEWGVRLDVAKQLWLMNQIDEEIINILLSGLIDDNGFARNRSERILTEICNVDEKNRRILQNEISKNENIKTKLSIIEILLKCDPITDFIQSILDETLNSKDFSMRFFAMKILTRHGKGDSQWIPELIIGLFNNPLIHNEIALTIVTIIGANSQDAENQVIATLDEYLKIYFEINAIGDSLTQDKEVLEPTLKRIFSGCRLYQDCLSKIMDLNGIEKIKEEELKKGFLRLFGRAALVSNNVRVIRAYEEMRAKLLRGLRGWSSESGESARILAYMPNPDDQVIEALLNVLNLYWQDDNQHAYVPEALGRLGNTDVKVIDGLEKLIEKQYPGNQNARTAARRALNILSKKSDEQYLNDAFIYEKKAALILINLAKEALSNAFLGFIALFKCIRKTELVISTLYKLLNANASLTITVQAADTLITLGEANETIWAVMSSALTSNNSKDQLVAINALGVLYQGLVKNYVSKFNHHLKSYFAENNLDINETSASQSQHSSTILSDSVIDISRSKSLLPYHDLVSQVKSQSKRTDEQRHLVVERSKI